MYSLFAELDRTRLTLAMWKAL